MFPVDKTLSLLLVCACVSLVVCQNATSDTPAVKTPCKKDDTKGLDDPDNVYYCQHDNEKCCITNSNPGCCPERDNSKDLIEQATIWASVVVLVVIIALVFICWRKDSKVCKGESCSECLANCCGRRVKKDKYNFDGVLIMGSGPSSHKGRKRAPALDHNVASIPGTVEEHGPAQRRGAPNKEGKRKANRKPKKVGKAGKSAARAGSKATTKKRAKKTSKKNSISRKV